MLLDSIEDSLMSIPLPLMVDGWVRTSIFLEVERDALLPRLYSTSLYGFNPQILGKSQK